jgi:hypothetical protein
MTLIEAIKSGKRFRRKDWKIDDWVSQDRDDLPLRLTRGDVKADDWEVEETVVTITDSDFERARERVDKKIECEAYFSEYLKELKKELGL